MSFSSNVKAELCRPPISRRTEALAEAYGVLLYCNTFTGSAVRVVTESRDFAERLPRLFKKAFGVGFDETPNPDEPGKLLLAIEQKDKLERLLTALDMRADGEVALHVNFGLLEEEPEQLAFFRGAFLAGGSVTDPAKRYHLELATPHLKVSAEASVLLREIGFSAKETSRAGNSILYFKQSDTIEDFLTAIGAQVSAMGVMEAKVEKDLRNGVNRRVNCETANLSKAVDASFEQLAAIRKLEEAGVLETLPQKLQETARLRRENPEATLSELAEMPDPPVSKSAINHRLRKLMELSKTL